MVVRSIYVLIVAALAAFVPVGLSPAAESPCPPVLDHKFGSLQGEAVSLCQFQGKVLLRVGQPVAAFESAVEPADPSVTSQIEKLLGAR